MQLDYLPWKLLEGEGSITLERTAAELSLRGSIAHVCFSQETREVALNEEALFDFAEDRTKLLFSQIAQLQAWLQPQKKSQALQQTIFSLAKGPEGANLVPDF